MPNTTCESKCVRQARCCCCTCCPAQRRRRHRRGGGGDGGVAPPPLLAPEFKLADFEVDFTTNQITIAWNAVPSATGYKVIVGPKSPLILNARFLTPTTPEDKAPSALQPLAQSRDAYNNLDEYLTTETSYTFLNPGANMFSVSVYSYIGEIRSSIPTTILSVNTKYLNSEEAYTGFNIMDNIVATLVSPGTYTLYNYKTLTTTPVTVPGRYYYNYANHIGSGEGNLAPNRYFGTPP